MTNLWNDLPLELKRRHTIPKLQTSVEISYLFRNEITFTRCLVNKKERILFEGDIFFFMLLKLNIFLRIDASTVKSSIRVYN